MSDVKLSSRKQSIALVTGATGFVGTHLVERLVRNGWKVNILSRPQSSLPESPVFAQIMNHIHDGSTQDLAEFINRTKPDVVFHLASLFLAQHETKDIESLIQSNILFGNQLLEAMKVNRVTNLINTGTSWQHYNNEDYNPVCLYAATKQAFEAILDFYIQAFDVKAITLKLFDTYGPADRRPKLFHLLEMAAKSGDPLNMSAGEQLIDLVHIDDVVEAYLLAAQRLLEGKVSTHETYAVSSNDPLSLRNIVEIYSKTTGRRVNINWGARAYRFREVMTTWGNGKTIENWYPKINLPDGLKGIRKQNIQGCD